MALGPLAPKDPEEKRSGFYVFLDKEVGGVPQDDGTNRHVIFLDNGRLVTFARMVGGVADEEMLGMLTTVDGFCRLVHSIGVTVAAPDREMEVLMTFQCYGPDGPFGGSEHTFSLRADGAERVIRLADLSWKPSDCRPGQFAFQLPSLGDRASVTMKFYLNDGYVVPETDPDPSVDYDSPAYREMIARSCLSTGNNYRLQRVLRRMRAGEDVTIAFLGGSITQGAGAVPTQENCYARRTFEGLRARYTPDGGAHLHYIKAGVGGTPSELGMIRYERDINRDGAAAPDLVVVEFAVNDSADETEGVCYESLIRKIWRQPNEPAVIMLFAVFSDDWNLKDRLAPIGWRHEIPMADVREAVTPQFLCRPGEGLVMTKRQFFYDIYHPSNHGHRVMADCLLYLIDRLDRQVPMGEPLREYPPVYGDGFAGVRLIDRRAACEGAEIDPGAFTLTDEDLQAVPLDDAAVNTPQFPYNWKKGPGEGAFRLTLECSRLLLVFKDSADERFGRVRVWVDGELRRLLDPREAGWTHCHAVILFSRRERARHTVEIAMDRGEEDKTFTILGFAYVP